MKRLCVLLGLCILCILFIYFSIFYNEMFIDRTVDIHIVNYIKKYPENNNINPLQDYYFNRKCCPSIYTSVNGCLCNNNYLNNLLVMKGGNRFLTNT